MRRTAGVVPLKIAPNFLHQCRCMVIQRLEICISSNVRVGACRGEAIYDLELLTRKISAPGGDWEIGDGADKISAKASVEAPIGMLLEGQVS
eukprot:SAG11_NODE_9768_length_882_cov_0.808429_1_plen_92_part_00